MTAETNSKILLKPKSRWKKKRRRYKKVYYKKSRRRKQMELRYCYYCCSLCGKRLTFSGKSDYPLACWNCMTLDNSNNDYRNDSSRTPTT